jgi:hypothetical protein
MQSIISSNNTLKSNAKQAQKGYSPQPLPAVTSSDSCPICFPTFLQNCRSRNNPIAEAVGCCAHAAGESLDYLFVLGCTHVFSELIRPRVWLSLFAVPNLLRLTSRHFFPRIHAPSGGNAQRAGFLRTSQA